MFPVLSPGYYDRGPVPVVGMVSLANLIDSVIVKSLEDSVVQSIPFSPPEVIEPFLSSYALPDSTLECSPDKKEHFELLKGSTLTLSCIYMI